MDEDALPWLDVGLNPRVLDGFWMVDCDDCAGTGDFLLPDDTPEPCVACKATGHAIVCLAAQPSCTSGEEATSVPS